MGSTCTNWRRGAAIRLGELLVEQALILKAFPDVDGQDVAPSPREKRGRRKMTPAQRQAVSKRMSKYWRERRKEAATQ